MLPIYCLASDPLSYPTLSASTAYIYVCILLHTNLRHTYIRTRNMCAEFIMHYMMYCVCVCVCACVCVCSRVRARVRTYKQARGSDLVKKAVTFHARMGNSSDDFPQHREHAQHSITRNSGEASSHDTSLQYLALLP